VSGLLVFNPSPFGRSGAVPMGEGAVRVVTDVPGLGFAFVPDGPVSGRSRQADRDAARGGQYETRLESAGGGIASLVHRATGVDLVTPGRALNALSGAVLTAMHTEVLDGVGARVVARRVTPHDVVITP
jgi:hypothetical protein